ncbi:hypothetical protein OBBRIDRAFT_378197 [Obba rivulosa]|uniref:Uncharacterized protein n=1 Tax=Obba rivulosa TaxID=1052685 RepID=A0A8E2AYR9_9APHY|nr:hypothetical protein OBBRIDRAFT_378197 [Obba rivulosa]
MSSEMQSINFTSYRCKQFCLLICIDNLSCSFSSSSHLQLFNSQAVVVISPACAPRKHVSDSGSTDEDEQGPFTSDVLLSYVVPDYHDFTVYESGHRAKAWLGPPNFLVSSRFLHLAAMDIGMSLGDCAWAVTGHYPPGPVSKEGNSQQRSASTPGIRAARRV